MNEQQRLFSEQHPKRIYKKLQDVDYREYKDLAVSFNRNLAGLISYIENRGLGTENVDHEQYHEAFSGLDVARYGLYALFPYDIEVKPRTTGMPIVKHISQLCMDVSTAYSSIQNLESLISEKDRRRLHNNPPYADRKAALVEDMKMIAERLIQEGVSVNEIHGVGTNLLEVLRISKPIFL